MKAFEANFQRQIGNGIIDGKLRYIRKALLSFCLVLIDFMIFLVFDEV